MSIRVGRTVCLRAILLFWASTCLTASLRVPDLKKLYDEHRWFELRDAIDETAPAFYRGAVACVFNDGSRCEKTFRSVIGSAPRSEDAAEARGLLLSLYHRGGRFRRAVAEIDGLLATYPDNTSLKSARALFGALARYPDQAIARRRHSTIRYRMKAGNLFVPVSIRGRAGHYIVDTGADFSLISESEARRLGLMVHDGGAGVTDITGGTVGVRTAVADELQVGETRLRHVGFLVVRDDQQPFADLAPDERGVLGLPALLAFDAFRWTADDAFEIAFPAQGAESSRRQHLLRRGDARHRGALRRSSHHTAARYRRHRNPFVARLRQGFRDAPEQVGRPTNQARDGRGAQRRRPIDCHSRADAADRRLRDVAPPGTRARQRDNGRRAA